MANFKGHVYDPMFRGSFSIKEIAPVMLGDDSSHAGMAIGDGGVAQVAYLELISMLITAERKVELEQQLLAY